MGKIEREGSPIDWGEGICLVHSVDFNNCTRLRTAKSISFLFRNFCKIFSAITRVGRAFRAGTRDGQTLQHGTLAGVRKGQIFRAISHFELIKCLFDPIFFMDWILHVDTTLSNFLGII